MNAIDALGLNIEIEEWKYTEQLPLYLIQTYTIKKVIVNGVDAIMLLPRIELPSTPAIKKHFSKIQSVENLPIFLKLDDLSDFRKKSLLTNSIPFIYLNKLVYLPFLGTVLTNATQESITEKFTLSTQLLFIWILHQNKNRVYVSDALSKLHFSNMTLTRAYRQLVNSGLFTETKDGRKIVLSSIYSKKELIQKAKFHFVSPILKTGYIDKNILNEKIICGESLLSEVSFLNPPRIAEYALAYQKIDNTLLTDELVDPKIQVKLQLWNYDPLLFSNDHQIIDFISLVISLLDSEDERVEVAIEHLLDQIEEGRNYDQIREI